MVKLSTKAKRENFSQPTEPEQMSEENQSEVQSESTVDNSAEVVAETNSEETNVVSDIVEPTPEDVQPEPEAQPEPEVEQKVEAPKVESVINKELEVKEVSAFEAFVAKVLEEGNPYRSGIVNTLNRYLASMKPGMPVEPSVGVRQHQNLWNNIRSIIDNCPEEEFRSTWNTLLAYFNFQKDSALGDRYIFRFMHEWDQGYEQCKGFQAIINLIKLTMDPETRANGLKQVSIERSMPEVISEAGRAKLLTFYQ